MTKQMEELRDKLAHDFVRGDDCEVMDLYSAHENTFSQGFDACYAEMEQLIEALKEIADSVRPNKIDYELIAEEALKKIGALE